MTLIHTCTIYHVFIVFHINNSILQNLISPLPQKKTKNKMAADGTASILDFGQELNIQAFDMVVSSFYRSAGEQVLLFETFGPLPTLHLHH